MKAVAATLGRVLGLLLVSAVALQLYFLARVVLLTVVNPQSTAFQRSEAWRLLTTQPAVTWRAQWVDYARISPSLKRAVIASEDAGFLGHSGVEWDAMERAWEHNQKAQTRVDQFNERAEQLADRTAANRAAPGKPAAKHGAPAAAARPVVRTEPRLVGGSTITQQLAKNLFLDGERSLPRKAQEFAITLMLEACLSKERILALYLNHVEWGEGVFGAEAAARHYFGIGADALTPWQAARLAVMLPAPKRFEKRPGSPYVSARAAAVAARMSAVSLP